MLKGTQKSKNITTLIILLYFAVAAFFYVLIYKYFYTLQMKLDKIKSVIWTKLFCALLDL